MSKPSKQIIIQASKIKNITPLKSSISSDDFIEQLALEKSHHNINLNITEIKPHEDFCAIKSTPKIFHHQNHNTINMIDEDIESLSYPITKDEITRIFQDITTIFQNPFSVAKYLKSLDEELGQRMADAGIEYKDAELPKFLIPARGHFIAGPPPESYKPRKQGRILEKILLEREMESGINMEGFMPKFAGYVDREKANEFVSAGHIFAEDAQVDNLILHSKRSHALGLEVIRRAAEMGELNLNTGSQTLNLQQLLEMFVKIKDYPIEDESVSFSKKEDSSSMWRYLLDSDEDSMSQALNKFYQESKARLKRNIKVESPLNELNKKSHDISNYSYSCRSPNVLNSVITCFGKELELPNLQHYQLNSHWKEAAQIVGRAREMIKDKNEDRINTNFSDLYTSCMKLFSRFGKASHSYITNTPVSLSAPESAESKKYTPFQDELGSDSQIKKKITLAKDIGQYDSWDDYIEQKSKQTQEENPPKKLDSSKTELPDSLEVIGSSKAGTSFSPKKSRSLGGKEFVAPVPEL